MFAFTLVLFSTCDSMLQWVHIEQFMSCVEHKNNLSIKIIIFWSILLNPQPGFPFGHISVKVDIQTHASVHSHFPGSVPTPVVDFQSAAKILHYFFELSGIIPVVLDSPSLQQHPTVVQSRSPIAQNALVSVSYNLLMLPCVSNVPGEFRGCVNVWDWWESTSGDTASCIHNQLSLPTPAACPKTINNESQIVFCLHWALLGDFLVPPFQSCSEVSEY